MARVSARRRIVLLAVAIAALLVPLTWLRIRDESRLARVESPLETAQQIATREANAVSRLEDRLDASLLSDSLAGVLARVAPKGWPAESLLVLADATLPAWRAARTDSLLRRAWQQVLPADGRVRVMAVVLRGGRHRLEPGSDVDNYRGSEFMLPHATDGRTCTIVVAVDQRSMSDSMRRAAAYDAPGDSTERLWKRARRNARATLGPCAYLAAFGPPGAGVRAWLDSTSWRGTYSANWSSSADSLVDWVEAARDRTSSIGEVVERSLAFRHNFYNRSSASTLRCLAGTDDECLRHVLSLHRAGYWYDDRSRPHFAAGVFSLVEPYALLPIERRILNPSPRLLADVVRASGREKFAAFWRGDGSFEQSFARAYGTPAAPWLHRWMRKGVDQPPDLGPGVTPRAMLAASALILLLLGVNLRVQSRRELK